MSQRPPPKRVPGAARACGSFIWTGACWGARAPGRFEFRCAAAPQMLAEQPTTATHDLRRAVGHDPEPATGARRATGGRSRRRSSPLDRHVHSATFLRAGPTYSGPLATHQGGPGAGPISEQGMIVSVRGPDSQWLVCSNVSESRKKSRVAPVSCHAEALFRGARAVRACGGHDNGKERGERGQSRAAFRHDCTDRPAWGTGIVNFSVSSGAGYRHVVVENSRQVLFHFFCAIFVIEIQILKILESQRTSANLFRRPT